MTTNTITETIKIVIYRENVIYLYGRWCDGLPEAQEVIDAHRAQEIIDAYPGGIAQAGNEPDFGERPCTWKWSVEVANAAI